MTLTDNMPRFWHEGKERPNILPERRLTAFPSKNVELDAWDRLQIVSQEIIDDGETYQINVPLRSRIMEDNKVIFRQKLTEPYPIEYLDTYSKFRSF